MTNIREIHDLLLDLDALGVPRHPDVDKAIESNNLIQCEIRPDRTLPGRLLELAADALRDRYTDVSRADERWADVAMTKMQSALTTEASTAMVDYAPTIIKKLRPTFDKAAKVVNEAAQSIDDRLAGFRAGGDDYLVKPYETRELLARVEALLRRSGRLKSAALAVGDLVIDPRSRSVAVAGTPIDVTRFEYDLLYFLANHPGQVFSKMLLLTGVWGFDHLDINRVERHISSLRNKLEAAGPRMVHTVRGAGYVFRA
jgi:DNA-binding response OmpR family regulator